MRLLSIAGLAGTALAGGPVPNRAGWQTVTYKGEKFMGMVTENLALSSEDIPSAPSECDTYVPDNKLEGSDILVLSAMFDYEYGSAVTHGFYNVDSDINGFNRGGVCIDTHAIFIIETYTENDGIWHPDIFSDNPMVVSAESCTVAQSHVFKDPLTVYACRPAAVDGHWGEWSDYGECKENYGRGATVRCNEAGKQIRTRSCDNPAPANGGSRCKKTNGPLDITEEMISDCSGYCAPVDGKWGDWSGYGVCSQTCGGGSKSRSRTCTNPEVKYGGKACVGSTSENENCNEQTCPVNGNWGEWSDYGACSLTCGGGSKSRSRTCTNPEPKYGGEACVGATNENENCNEQACPGISAKCNDDNTISVKIDYDRAGSILSASYGTCGAADMTGADASNVKTWDLTLSPSRCNMESKLRTLDYNQTAKFTIGRKHGNTQMVFATFEVDSYCSYTSEYTVSFSYGPISADSFDFTDSGGLLGLNFYIASYSSGSYAVKAAPSTQAGKTVYLKLALNATLNDDFDHAANMDASSGKVFVPTKCAVDDDNSNSYTLFDTSSSKCANDNIDLSITYNSGDKQSWYIAHTLFLLNDENRSTFTLSCNVLVCDAAEITDCKNAYNCLTNSGGTR